MDVGTSRDVLARCRGLGFALAGIAGVEPSRFEREYRSWISERRHGSMAYLGRDVASRMDPGAVLPGARAAIMVADRYARRGGVDSPATPGRGRIARYARGSDYHRVMKRRLHALCDALRAEHAGEQFRAFVDTAPILERELAQRAGLGWVGKHTLIIHPREGSYLLLGGVLTTLRLPMPEDRPVEADHCGTCTRCIDACPTGCITPYSIDASRCVSYLTIERRERIDTSAHEGMGDWLFGCDVCQEVCPHNSARPSGQGLTEPRAEYAERTATFDLLDVLGWTAERRADATRGSALKRATLSMMRRNAAIAAGNAVRAGRDASGALRARLGELACDSGEVALVRDAARDALSPR
ncbi:MAG: tRNA epoxyqueuosine(34) reductase QueG [Phycisphaeraceae bacterium]|nr:tRNA epoxyqueuosine(34) reductase QueG [Phycisphaeraceae bacterium]